MTTIDAVRDPHWAVVLQILSPRSSSLRSGPSLALERGFPATSRNELKDGCTTLKWNRWRDVGQAGSLRATQRVPRLPPLSAAIAAVGRLTIGRSLPSCPTGAPPAWRTTYTQMQALLLMNRAGVHFCVAHPRRFGCWPCTLRSLPSVLRAGPYRFFFYSADRGEPPHVHVEREEGTAKFWLEPVRLEKSRGFGRVELGRIQRLVEENAAFLLRLWHEYFGN